MKPFFSIIIPVYNVAPYLRECLDSVLAQTFTNWEAICVDDGSTDGSGVILDEYAHKDNRFKVLHRANGGVSVARNAALKVVVGEWITFLDGDDKIDPARLQVLSKIIFLNPGIDWIHETDYLTNSSNRNITFAVESSCEVITDNTFLSGWAMFKKNALLCLNTYKRRCIRGVQFPMGVRYAEDDIFELRCLFQCKSVAVAGYCGYWYRDDRVDAASRRIAVEDSVKIHELLLETVESQSHYIDSLREHEEFVKLFSQTVRKDLSRVFRKFTRAPRPVREKHHAVSRRIYCSKYFSVWYAGPYKVGYWIYLRTGWFLPMLIQAFGTRVVSNVLRCFLHKKV